MMPQKEVSESMHEQTGPTYGRYVGDQGQHDQTSYEQLLRDNKNMLRLIVFAIAMVTLIAFGFLCLMFVGGTGGWISFCAASLAIFIIAVVALDKIK